MGLTALGFYTVPVLTPNVSDGSMLSKKSAFQLERPVWRSSDHSWPRTGEPGRVLWPRVLESEWPQSRGCGWFESNLKAGCRWPRHNNATPRADYPSASGLRKLALLGSNTDAGGLGFRDVPGAFPHMPAPRERLQRLLASCPVAMRVRAAAFVLLPIGQSPTPRCSRRCRLGQSDVTNDLVPSEHPVLVSDWAGALEQKVGQTTTLRLLS
jgi:hypothetical protein